MKKYSKDGVRKSKGSFALKLPNSKPIKFRTHEAFSAAYETIIQGRYANVGLLAEAIRAQPRGFEFADAPVGKKNKEVQKKFNSIDFDD